MSENGKEKLGLDKITCPECHKTTDSTLWEECAPYCEECGNHDGLKCPECGEFFDHVWGFEKLMPNKN